MLKRDSETYQKCFQDFEILPKFSETQVFQGTIPHPSIWIVGICFQPCGIVVNPSKVDDLLHRNQKIAFVLYTFK